MGVTFLVSGPTNRAVLHKSLRVKFEKGDFPLLLKNIILEATIRSRGNFQKISNPGKKNAYH
jgi:hypothetical protein